MDRTTPPLHCQAGSVSVWRPENLDVDALLKAYGQRVAEGVLWLGHCVFTGLADDARCRDTGRVRLLTEYLRNVVGRHHVDAVRQAAIEAGYVDRDRSYRVGDHSQSYWVLPPYDRARLVRREITDSALRRNIRIWRESRRRATWQRIRRNDTLVDAAVCDHLWRNLRRVRIDAGIGFPEGFPEGFHPAHQVAVEHLRQAEFWLTVDDFGRIHTNLTNLPRELRRHLTVEGERLANVDISESQPLFMGMAIAKSSRPASATAEGEGTRRRDRRQGESSRRGSPYHMLDNTMLDNDPLLAGELDRGRLQGDVRRYLELCEARGLYQAVADRLDRTRDEAKRGVLVTLYDRPSHRNAVSAVLDELFPGVMQAMRRIKRPDYRCLAHFAQRIESGFMFGRVVPRIMATRPNLFISTIHDSILTPAGEAPFVRQVMLDEFARLGLSPQVKVEPCSRAC